MCTTDNTAVTTRACTHPGCARIKAEDSSGAPSSLCQHHLMLWRRGMGLCANCGGQREQVAVINDLTGRQLRRGPQRLPVFQMRCTSCGRTQRAEVTA